MKTKTKTTRDGIPVPAGFHVIPLGHRGDSYANGVERDDSLIRISWDRDERPASGIGRTEYRADAGAHWYSYDRIGVEASFYFKNKRNLVEVIAGEIVRACEGIVRARVPRTPVPGLGWSLTAERRQQLTQQLHFAGWIELRPSGFGTGYRISTRRPSRDTRYDPQPHADLAAYFGASCVFLRTIDCD